MTELDLGLEHASASTDSPGDNWFRDLTLLYSLDHPIFLDTTNLTEQKEDFTVRLRLVAKEMVDEGRSGVSIAANGDALVYTVCGLRDYVVELVRHRSEEHTSELQSHSDLVCRLLLEK